MGHPQESRRDTWVAGVDSPEKNEQGKDGGAKTRNISGKHGQASSIGWGQGEKPLDCPERGGETQSGGKEGEVKW